jgi:MFS transporter, MHS family, shikimate and dehydroshikimate transport protein
VFQVAGIFSSGPTPLIAAVLLVYGGGQPWLVCLYVAAVSLVSFFSVVAMRLGDASLLAEKNIGRPEVPHG